MTSTTNEKDAPKAKSPAATGLSAKQNTNNAKIPTPEAQSKGFATMAAGFAMNGHALHRSDPKDGTVTFWAERWGLVRYLPTIDAARRFLDQIGGRM